MTRLIDVYPYREEQKEVKFLIFKRAADATYPNQWRMIGGKVQENEKAYEAALRELSEETALTPSTFWAIPSVNHFYDPQADQVNLIPAFAGRVEPKGVKLNHEHVDYKWISLQEISDYIFWPEQRRLMMLLASIVVNNQILEEWIIK